jgi:hypothetical protein
MRLSWVVCGALSACSIARVALAGDAETAEALFQSGREAMARGDLAAACPRLAESQRLDPAAGTLLNLAECEERAGKVASALLHFQEAHDELPPGDYRIPFSAERIAELTPRVPRLVLKVRGPLSPKVTVVRDGTTLEAASFDLPLPVDPGAHSCVLRWPGHQDATAEVTVREGETKILDLAPGAVFPSGGPAKDRGSPQRRWGWGLGAGGLGALLAGGIFGITSKVTYDNAKNGCPDGNLMACPTGVSGSQSAYTQAEISDVAFVAGGALVAAGIVLYLTAPKGMTVAPAVGAREAGLTILGGF